MIKSGLIGAVNILKRKFQRIKERSEEEKQNCLRYQSYNTQAQVILLAWRLLL